MRIEPWCGRRAGSDERPRNTNVNDEVERSLPVSFRACDAMNQGEARLQAELVFKM